MQAQLDNERNIEEQNWRRWTNALRLATDYVTDVMASRGEEYDNDGPPWHRMPFGMESWATLLTVKSSRLNSAVRAIGGGEVDAETWRRIREHLRDLAAYALMASAWTLMMEGVDEADAQQFRKETTE